MEIGKKVQGARGFVTLNGQVFGYNTRPDTQLRPHQSIVADLASKGINLDQLNLNHANTEAVVTETEQNMTARRGLER